MSLMNPIVANLVVNPIDRTAATPSISFGGSADDNSGTGIYGSIIGIHMCILGSDIMVASASSISFAVAVNLTGQITFSQPIVVPSFTTIARDALTPAAGWMIFNSTDLVGQMYDGTVWQDLF